MITVTLPLKDYEDLKSCERAHKENKIRVSCCFLGMGAFAYEIAGLHDDERKIIKIMNEENERLRKKISELESKDSAIADKKRWFFKW